DFCCHFSLSACLQSLGAAIFSPNSSRKAAVVGQCARTEAHVFLGSTPSANITKYIHATYKYVHRIPVHMKRKRKAVGNEQFRVSDVVTDGYVKEGSREDC